MRDKALILLSLSDFSMISPADKSEQKSASSKFLLFRLIMFQSILMSLCLFIEDKLKRKPQEKSGEISQSEKQPKESSKPKTSSQPSAVPALATTLSPSTTGKKTQNQGGNQREPKDPKESKENKDSKEYQKQQHKPQDKLHQQQSQNLKPQAQSCDTKATNLFTSPHHLKLFDHLPRRSQHTSVSLIEGAESIHPATTKLGYLFRSGLIRNDDDRVVALISTFSRVIQDYSTPTGKSLNWDLDKVVKIQVQYLVDNRQHSIGMGNLIKHLRSAISCLSPQLTEAAAKEAVIEVLKQYLEEKIIYARESIIKHCESIIKHGDVILTYGSSPLLRQVLLGVSKTRTFRLIIVDSRPLNDGLETLKCLSPVVKCVYTSLSSAAGVMKEVTHVLLGASSLLCIGSMLAPAGTAMVASLARWYRIPVIAVAETYKFSEKVYLDAIVHNELGSPAEIACMGWIPTTEPMMQTDGLYRGTAEDTTTSSNSISTQTEILPFQVLNLRYDLVPVKNISAVLTETGLIPPTSIPVLTREFQQVDVSSRVVETSFR